MSNLKNLLLKNHCGVQRLLKTLCYQRNFSVGNRDQANHITSDENPQISASLKWLHTRLFSSNSERMKVLTKSTMIMQDGIDIEELPILIRRATRDSFPFTTHSYTGQRIRGESEFEVSFRESLRGCTSVGEVFKLLEVPANEVGGYAAAFALQRLHVLKHLNTDWNQIHSFIRSAVMRELYDTVQADVHQLSNQTLISLVECYIAAKGFSPSCMDAVNAEIQCRLAESTFTVEEILTLANILKTVQTELSKSSPQDKPKSSTMTIATEAKSRFLSTNLEDKGLNAKYFDKFCANAQQTKEITHSKCSSLLEDVWIHVASRYNEMSEETLPITMDSLTADQRNLINLLEKPMQRSWQGLSPEGVRQCLESIVRLNMYSPRIMTSLGCWSHVNVHQLTPQLLLSYLHTFMHFNYMDQNIIRTMERCLKKSGAQIETDILGLCVEYCRMFRYLSPVVMDVAAQHFTDNGKSYEPLQIYAVLRAFGHLNYLPENPSTFLSMVESVLTDKFSEIEPSQMLEVLGCLTFAGVIPHNFVDKLTSDYFFFQVGELQGKAKRTALMWIRVIRRSLNFATQPQAAEIIRDKTSSSKYSMLCYTDNNILAVKLVRNALSKVLGDGYFHVFPHYECYVFYVDKEGVPLPINNEKGVFKPKGEVAQRYALILRSADHFTVNTRQLLGAQAQRKAHLEQLGYQTIEVRSGEFIFSSSTSPLYLKDILMNFVDFGATKERIQTEETAPQTLSSTDEEEEEEDEERLDTAPEFGAEELFQSLVDLKTPENLNTNDDKFSIWNDDDDF